MNLCTLINPYIDLVQTGFNITFFWATLVGIPAPNARAIFSFLGC